jgi:hypothetical protein
MVDDLKLFRQSALGVDYEINERVKIHHPTLNEICEFGEQQYYGMATALTCNPSAYKVALHDMGIDYETLKDFDFFIMMCQSMPRESTKLLLGDLDLSKLVPGHNSETDEVVLCETVDGEPMVVIDRAIYTQMTNYIRKIHGFEKKVDKTADNHTKLYLIERERKRIARSKKAKYKSLLKPLISSMVNQPGFKYDYTTVWDLPITVFNDSVNRIQKYFHYAHTMQGAYAGTVDLKKVNTEELNWLN